MKGNESVWTKIMRNKSFSNQSNYRIFSQRLLLDNWDPSFCTPKGTSLALYWADLWIRISFN